MKVVLRMVVMLALAVAACAAQGTQSEPGKQGQAPAQPGQPSPEESQAYQSVQNELDPDRKLEMVGDFEKKFPNSPFLPFVYLMAADTYRQKNDIAKVIEYGRKSVKLRDDNPVALILVASLLPEPQAMKGSDLEKEKNLTEAEEYANRAIKLVEQFSKQPNMTDEEHRRHKAMLSSWAHSSLGMVHLQRAGMGLTGLDPEELTKSEQEYQLAVSSVDSPNPGDYFRLGEAYKGHGKTDEAIEAFTKAGQLDQSGAIKALADQAIEELKKKKKAAEKPPAK